MGWKHRKKPTGNGPTGSCLTVREQGQVQVAGHARVAIMVMGDDESMETRRWHGTPATGAMRNNF
jgi:hypothetical protein